MPNVYVNYLIQEGIKVHGSFQSPCQYDSHEVQEIFTV